MIVPSFMVFFVVLLRAMMVQNPADRPVLAYLANDQFFQVRFLLTFCLKY